ncbi:MAG: DUF2459 domain-containing protein [Pseudomonadota bacterium]
MRYTFRSCALLCLLATGAVPTAWADGETNPYNLWLAVEGKHTNLVLRTDDTHGQLPLPEAQLPAGRYVMLSWGDAAYYQASRKTLRMTLRALFLPTQAAINARALTSLSEAPQTRAQASLYGFKLRSNEMADLLAYVRSALVVRDGEAVGLGGNSHVGGQFYLAHDRRYSLLYTCNNWTAALLRAGGQPFGTRGSQLPLGLKLQHRVARLLSSRYRQVSTRKPLVVRRKH